MKKKNFKFICSVCIWNEVLEQFDRVSKSLQMVESNLATAVMLLSDLNKYLDSYKLDGYEKAIQNALLIAEENEIIAIFETPRRGRKRAEKSAEEVFQTDFFECLIKTAKESIAERFSALSTHCELYSFLYEFDQLEERYKNGQLLIACQKLENALKRDEVSDIDGNEIFNELRILGRLISENKPTAHVIDALNLINYDDVITEFANLKARKFGTI